MPNFKPHKAGGYYAIESFSGGESRTIYVGQATYNDVVIHPARAHIAAHESDGNTTLQGDGGIIASVIPPYTTQDVNILRYEKITITNASTANLNVMIATADVIGIANDVFKECPCSTGDGGPRGE